MRWYNLLRGLLHHGFRHEGLFFDPLFVSNCSAEESTPSLKKTGQIGGTTWMLLRSTENRWQGLLRHQLVFASGKAGRNCVPQTTLSKDRTSKAKITDSNHDLSPTRRQLQAMQITKTALERSATQKMLSGLGHS